ncbi:hypothetical protein QYN14_25750 [Rhodococcus ruber]|uniref:hypothetical protein n=1 Tax=Rhodococcus ruber TaxID=1830 RepID=UPI00265A4949|nr:hypothetical protein [Rhodococcus ruber]WKK11955.1 hypothetical protein QYN14_25335 [Rhodococcus ruber]WKK12038.1 hypothetical protein QYN14_25750 [Rhodococcus ruber]
MTPEQIAEGRRLLAAATPGPWVVGGRSRTGGVYFGNQNPEVEGPSGDAWDSDAELIVWARNNLPALLDRLERAQADMWRLMNDLHETAEGLGRWHDQTEYIEWAEKEVRQIWLRSKGLDSRGKPLDGE